MHEWICELCWPGFTEIAMLTPTLAICRGLVGEITLIGGQGHTGDDIYVFALTPLQDPFTVALDLVAGDEEAMAELTSEADDHWIELYEAMFSDWPLKLDVTMTWALVQDCIDNAGYDPDEHGRFELWLVHKVATLIAEKEGIDGVSESGPDPQ